MSLPPETPGRDGVVARLISATLASDRVLGGRTRLVCIDGLAGAGKTTLAAALERGLREEGLTVVVVHMDDLYEGWSGLLAAREEVTALVSVLAAGGPAVVARYDWARGDRDAPVTLPAADVVVIEGCGSAPPAVSEVAAVTVVVTADDDVRLARGLARDGEELRPQWLAFMADEARLELRDRTSQRAEVVLDSTGSPLRWRPRGDGVDVWKDRPHG